MESKACIAIVTVSGICRHFAGILQAFCRHFAGILQAFCSKHLYLITCQSKKHSSSLNFDIVVANNGCYDIADKKECQNYWDRNFNTSHSFVSADCNSNAWAFLTIFCSKM
jgi:hypothetical protein